MPLKAIPIFSTNPGPLKFMSAKFSKLQVLKVLGPLQNYIVVIGKNNVLGPISDLNRLLDYFLWTIGFGAALLRLPKAIVYSIRSTKWTIAFR